MSPLCLFVQAALVAQLLTAPRSRLDRDFIVFHGTEHESSGQLLKGTVVLCLPAPLKVEDVHLRLTGSLHLA